MNGARARRRGRKRASEKEREKDIGTGGDDGSKIGMCGVFERGRRRHFYISPLKGKNKGTGKTVARKRGGGRGVPVFFTRLPNAPSQSFDDFLFCVREIFKMAVGLGVAARCHPPRRCFVDVAPSPR